MVSRALHGLAPSLDGMNASTHNALRGASRTAILVVCFLVAAACTSKSPAPYADRYRQALIDYRGTAPLTADTVQPFIDHFNHLDSATAADTERLYAPRLYFSDTLLTTESRSKLLNHLAGLRENDVKIAVQTLKTVIDGEDAYLHWSMITTFRAGGRSVTTDSIGITHLRFNAAGQIVLQQDFWDSTEGFYRHLPFVGGLINNIAKGFSDAE